MKKCKSICTIVAAVVCMVSMVFAVSPDISYADTPAFCAKAVSKKAGQITLTLYTDDSAFMGVNFYSVDTPKKYNGGMAVYQKKGTGKYKRIKTLKAGTKTYTVKNLQKNVKYSYKIIPYNAKDTQSNKFYVQEYMPAAKAVTAVTKDSTKFKNVSKVKSATKNITINYGKKKIVKVKLTPTKKAVSKKLKWYVAPGSTYLLKVNQKGQVTALHSGVGYIYAEAHNGVVTKCKVTVKNPKKTPEAFTCKVVKGGVKITPKKNSQAFIDYEVTGDGYRDTGFLYDKAETAEMDPGDKLTVEAYIYVNNKKKVIQTYTYTMPDAVDHPEDE